MKLYIQTNKQNSFITRSLKCHPSPRPIPPRRDYQNSRGTANYCGFIARGDGVLPYISHIGISLPKGYHFRVWSIKRWIFTPFSSPSPSTFLFIFLHERTCSAVPKSSSLSHAEPMAAKAKSDGLDNALIRARRGDAPKIFHPIGGDILFHDHITRVTVDPECTQTFTT